MAEALPLEDLVTCAVCQEIYREPMALRCLHTLCGCCVQTMKNRSRIANCIQCPMCREISDVRYLKHDFRIKNLVEIYKSQRKLKRDLSVEISETSCCQLCRKKVFTGKCVDCNKLICDGCQETHKSIPMCESHVVLSLSDLLSDCGLSIARINEALLLDRNNLIEKFYVLVEYINNLEKEKQDTLLSLENSEECVIRKIKEHYVTLREDLENGINEHRLKAENAKSQILDVVGKVMERSQKVVDAVSGADVGTVLMKIEDLRTETEMLDTENELQLQMPKFDLVQGPQWDSFDLSQVVSLKSTNCDFEETGVTKDEDDASSELSLSEILQNASNILEYTEKSSVHYKFQYCDQVRIMLEKLKNNLITYSESLCGSSELVAGLPNSHCMVSPSSLNLGASRSNKNCSEIISLALKQPISAEREVLLPKCDEPQSLTMVGSEIWCVYQDSVRVYDNDLVLKNTLSRIVLGGKQYLSLKSILQTREGHYFQACDDGLRVLKPTRSFIRFVHQGQVSDVAAAGEHVLALDVKAGEILVFEFHELSDPRHRESPWKLKNTIKMQCTLSVDDTLAFVDGVIVVCSYRNDAIYRYNLDGMLLTTNQSSPSRKGPGHLWRPRICCQTSDGSLIIADHYHNRLQLLTPSGEWQVLKFERDLNFPWDAVLANEYGLVVLEKCNWKHKLVQFALKEY